MSEDEAPKTQDQVPEAAAAESEGTCGKNRAYGDQDKSKRCVLIKMLRTGQSMDGELLSAQKKAEIQAELDLAMEQDAQKQ